MVEILYNVVYLICYNFGGYKLASLLHQLTCGVRMGVHSTRGPDACAESINCSYALVCFSTSKEC